MKYVFLLTFIILSSAAQAQWSNTTNNYTTGTLGIGLNNTSQKKIWVQANVNDHIGILENTSTSGFGLIVNSANDPLRVGPLGDYSGAYFKIATNGNVGINVTNPNSRLDIATNAQSGLNISGNTSSWTGSDISITRSNSSGGVGNAPSLQFNDPGSNSYNLLQSSSGGLQFFNCCNNNTGWIERLRIASNGNVGIGTNNPQAQLEVNTSSKFGIPIKLNKVSDTFGTDYSAIWVNCSGPNCNYGNPASDLGVIRIDGFGTTGTAINSNNNFVVKLNGNVGIGITDPGSFKLAVNGKTWTTEVQVAVTRPPDYVFEPTYHLSPLDSIKTYIDKNKHLPEVPSAKEMEKNGVNLGEMNMLLLKKIEELTLYVIELKKENEEQNKTIKKLIENK